ncbi:MAG: ABC transporter substrate-binding protein, partial [Alphaproteobacteria bacterium]
SSAMDLQVKLANDGLAASWRSGATAALPSWARWRNQVIAFTEEAAVVVARRDALAGTRLPETRQALITLLSAHPERFRGRIGTYDVRRSGLGYLFATEDARLSDSYWRLMQEMGNLSPRLYCCSGEMIEALERGTLAVAYNVLGSYARPRIAGRDDLVILPMRDFTNVMMRTAVIPATAPRPALAGAFIDFLLSERGRRTLERDCGLPPLGTRTAAGGSARPIRLGPGLLVYLDRLKRQAFLAEWAAAMVQP